MAKVSFDTNKHYAVAPKVDPEGEFDVPEADLVRWQKTMTLYERAQAEMAKLAESRGKVIQKDPDAEADEIIEAAFGQSARERYAKLDAKSEALMAEISFEE